ncbi:uncharacterized protein EDB91DRAFT_1245391 [Suillus paluster]|uniref:uncharacterized protein n=1 Tax=Suillus paluster TaxID=48578 RepID=UPI001B86F6F1|nr:uncharacterized protein EDB91DRAFT_1245391 [Suillus paluster]KAG1747922.1 hypothetical protein EDB91DRAFT_1245391 [Suillus paluster]
MKEIKRHHLHLYDGILNIVPSLRDELDMISSDKLSKIISAVTKGMSDARLTAFSSIKHKGLKYVPLNMHSKEDALDPPIPEVKDKSMRGITHPQLAQVALPSKQDFMKTASTDPTDKTKGLFRNHVVARFYMHLYIGPSAAMAESTTSKASKVARNCAFGLTSITKNIIAIVHIITYFTLSHGQNWTNEIGTMNLEELFWAIINMLDDDEDPWVKDTMSLWNTAKFIKKPSNLEDDLDQENNIAEIKAQCLARRGAAPPQAKAQSDGVTSPATSARLRSTSPTLPLFPPTPYPYPQTLSGALLLCSIGLTDPTPSTISTFLTHLVPSVPLVLFHPTIGPPDRLTGPPLD